MAFVVGALAIAPLAVRADAVSTSGPSTLASFDGPFDLSSGPPDATLAAGPNRVVELVNSQYAIVNRDGVGVSGPIGDLVAPGQTVFLSDPQVVWDPDSNRFYFSIFENHGSSTPDEGIAWGFSKTATPNTTADWCTYFNRFDYGSSAFPDRPSLGITNDFVMFVSERFSVPDEGFEGVDAAWVSKPQNGRNCPSGKSTKSGISRLLDPSGAQVAFGTAVRQVDPSRTGWILAQPQVGGSSLLLFKVSPNGSAATVGAPTILTVPAYSFPPAAPQAGLTAAGNPAPALETKGYLTQAYSAFDPRLGHVDIWTAHGIAAGAGAAVRWYEIDPSSATLDQTGTVEDPDLYVFNATIAPDRLVNGRTAAFGSDMVMTFNTSSSTTDPTIGVVSKRGADPQSPIDIIKTSPGPNVDADCFQPTRSACRWGDYSGTSPDPGASPNGTAGQVWLTNQWNVTSVNDSTEAWRIVTALVSP